jgi:hypothetical protein
MPQDEDLKVLSSVTASKQHEQVEGAAECEVGEFGQDQGGLRRVDRAHSVELQSGVNQQIRSRVRPLRTLHARRTATAADRMPDAFLWSSAVIHPCGLPGVRMTNDE